MSGGHSTHGGPPMDRALLEQAADWLVRIKMETVSARDERALADWIARSDQHKRAWTLAQDMLAQLDGMPSALAMPVLSRPRNQRRRAVLRIAALLAVGLGAAQVQQAVPWRAIVADYATSTGARRRQTLADGTLLELNTDTAVDVRFDDSVRAVRLIRGEILVTTGKDAAHPGPFRPFIVDTAQGRIRALGTRFSVRDDGAGDTRVVVFEDAVEILPAASPDVARRVESAQQMRFSATAATERTAAPKQEDAWTRGLRVAVDERLDALLNDLGRYHRGIIRCDPAIAGLRVTGTYNVDDIAGSLASLQDSHPLQVRFMTRYFIQVSAR